MHELSIVKNMMELITQKATAQQATKVTLIKLKFNPLCGFDEEDIKYSFDILKKDNPLFTNTTLEITLDKGTVECNHCKERFEVEELPNICQKCGSIDLKPLVPTTLILESYTIEK
jgi:hydrogenase nickel insertion protein HypA